MSTPPPTASEPSRPRTYFGWQQEQVAFLYGMSGHRFALVAVAILAAVWPLAASNLQAGIITWPVAAVLGVLAFLRVGGRTVDEWLTAAVSYGIGRMGGQHKFASAAFAPPAKTAAPDAPRPADLPGVLAPLTILEAEMPDGAPLAIAHHRHDKTFTAVARIRFPGIGLVDSSRREQRVAGWGALLAGLCTEGSPITRVQALQRLVPESGAALRRWDRDHTDPDSPDLADRVVTGLLGAATLATSSREAYLAFTMDGRKAARVIKHAGGGTVGAAAVLTRQLRAQYAAIAGADLQIEAWLGPRDLAEVLRTAFDPHSARHLAERRATATGVRAGQLSVAAADDGEGETGGLEAGVDPAVAGPAAAEARPGVYTHDGAHSVTFWVHSWPRNEVYATALAPLLGEGVHRRAFSFHVEPLGPRDAEREVMRERTARSVAVKMRQKSGQIVPEHEQVALDRARAQDAERAAGHGLVRIAAYVTLTVTNADDVEDACAALEADAAAARIELRRMWFAQDIGFAMGALPLGYGLPKKRW
ncbi:SCO6880 family protein [Dactylosporangium sp. NPDC000521]|uniref:SCO6880 family protein n=1 Tax=Dactylosporangium sp. NPDC000521 TaxID=3363975 RepID=UPI003698B77C